MTRAPALAAALAALFAVTSASADLSVTFDEGAPKDRFSIRTSCATPALDLTIALSGSAAGLIFDTTGEGAGVQVFQPVEVASGARHVRAIGPVTDGDTTMIVSLAPMAAGESVTLTTDVDDTRPAGTLGQIRVSGSEIAGAAVTVTSSAGTSSATFGASDQSRDALANVTLSYPCAPDQS